MARLLVVLLVMLVALSARLLQLGLAAGLANANHDEGVYASAAQLLLHGVLPYRDYFYPHPPVAVLLLSPAMVLDRSSWGDPDTFVAARQLSVAYSLISVAAVFAIGHRLAGWWGATAAALVWSLDERVVLLSSQAMLDVPMAMLSFGGILTYLTVQPGPASQLTPRHRMIGVAIAGGLTALSGLTKVVGFTALLAIVADLLWRHMSRRAETEESSTALLGSLLLGAGLVSVVALAPFVIAAPGEVLSQTVFFQLLRPSNEIGPIERIGRLVERPDQLPILVMAALGIAAVAARFGMAVRRRPRDGRRGAGSPLVGSPLVGPTLAGWSVVMLWAGLNALTYVSTGSFHPQYQLHLLAPLALFAAGVGLLPQWLTTASPAAGLVRRWEYAALLLVILVVGVQHALAWNRSGAYPVPEHVAMSRHLRHVVPPDSRVFTMDARVTFLAGREPSRGATGYLVDPYSHIVYFGLQLADRSSAEVLEAVVRGEEHSWETVAGNKAGQADLLARLRDADLVIVHENERWRLGAAAIALDAMAAHVDRFGSYLLYAMERPPE